MANARRGEIAAELGGRSRTLCLTLGALAELETAFGADDLSALAGRLGEGRLSARDAIRIIGAGLRGAGHDIDDATVAGMAQAGGALGYADIVVRLLLATFGDGAEGQNPPQPRARVRSRRTPSRGTRPSASASGVSGFRPTPSGG